MAEIPVTEDNSHEEIDEYAAEQGVEVSGTKAEKIDQLQAAAADQGAEDDLPEPQAEPAPPAPGETEDESEDAEEQELTDIQQEIADGKRRADGTVKPTVKKASKPQGGFATGLASTAAQFKHRKDTPSSLPESEGSSA